MTAILSGITLDTGKNPKHTRLHGTTTRWNTRSTTMNCTISNPALRVVLPTAPTTERLISSALRML